MSKLKPNQRLIDALFQPNLGGKSDWISIEDVVKIGLRWSKNGNCRHGVFFGDNRYVWEKAPKTGAIRQLRLNGVHHHTFDSLNRPIRKDIRAYHVSQSCIVCGSKSDLVCDHKNDVYNDPRVLDTKTQTLEDFQCLCNHCNLQKRQIAKETRSSGKRYGATRIPQLAVFGIDFIQGDETFDQDNPNAMIGTYWHDPVAFMTYIKEHTES